MRSAIVKKAFFTAPVLLLVGVVAMKFGWKGNTDLDWGVALPIWTGAHVAYILGYLAFGIVLGALWSWARGSARGAVERGGVDVLAVVGAIGLVATLGQMVIDLLVGFRAENRAGMGAISQTFRDIPGFDTFFYGAVPAMQLTVTALLILVLAVRREVTTWSALLFLAGSVCVGTGVTALMVTGGAALCVALPSMTRRAGEATIQKASRKVSSLA
jgi:hypothetical protein